MYIYNYIYIKSDKISQDESIKYIKFKLNKTVLTYKQKYVFDIHVFINTCNSYIAHQLNHFVKLTFIFNLKEHYIFLQNTA
jgi:hypothetical protein